MKILVTGGTVFVSRFAAEYFVKKGHEVYVLNRNTRPQSDGVKLINCDRHNLGNILKNIEFDLVLDVTAYTRKDVSDLLDGLGKFGDYILISSSAVYPETLPQPFSVGMQTGENIHWGDYGTNKIQAEEMLLNRVKNAYILRPPYLYGAMNNLYREAFVFDCAELDLPFYIPDEKLGFQFFDVEDLCRFVEIIVSQKPDIHVFNVGNPDFISVSDWANICYSVLGKKAEIRIAPEKADVYKYFPFKNYAYLLDVIQMNRYMPKTKPLEQGLRESYEWYRNNRELVRRKPLVEYITDNF